jgi:hypothetical protein
MGWCCSRRIRTPRGVCFSRPACQFSSTLPPYTRDTKRLSISGTFGKPQSSSAYFLPNVFIPMKERQYYLSLRCIQSMLLLDKDCCSERALPKVSERSPKYSRYCTNPNRSKHCFNFFITGGYNIFDVLKPNTKFNV